MTESEESTGNERYRHPKKTNEQKAASRERAEVLRPMALRRSIFSLLPQLIFCFGLTLLLYWIVSMSLNSLDYFGASRIWLRVLGILPAVFFLNTLRLYFNNRYIIGRQRLRLYRGLLSLNLDKPAVDYNDIREIQVDQQFLGRIFNFGNVSVGTAASGSFDIVLENIGNPYAIQKLLDDRRRLRSDKLISNLRSGAE